MGLYLLPKGIGLLLLIEMVCLWTDLPMLFGHAGLIEQELLPHWHSGVFWSVNDLLSTKAMPWIYAFAAGYILLCLALIYGKWLRIAILLLMLLHQTLFLTDYRWSYGVDYLAQTGLFISLCFSPANPVNTTVTPITYYGIRFFQIQLSLVYFFGGLGKALSASWWNGEAIWKAIQQPFIGNLINVPLSWGSYTWGWTTLGCSILTFELFYGLAWIGRRLRYIILASILAMHLGIAVFLGLYHFAALMIWYNLCAWYFPYKNLTKPINLSLERGCATNAGTASTTATTIQGKGVTD